MLARSKLKESSILKWKKKKKKRHRYSANYDVFKTNKERNGAPGKNDFNYVPSTSDHK